MDSKIKQIKLPIDQEVTQKALSIQGNVPDWVKGTFVRNGPVSVQINNQKQAHWFDGLAMLHAFTFSNGNINYTNKFLKSDPYHTVFVKNSLNFLGFDSLSSHPLWDKIKAFLHLNKTARIQNANVTVAKVANQHIVLTETPLPVRFAIENMDTLGAFEFQDDLSKENIFDSAHIKQDGRTSEQFNYLVDYGLKSQYVLYRYHPSAPRREMIGRIKVDKPAYMHSFALTENYIILVEFPFVVNPISMMLMNKPFIKNYYWAPERGTNFIIVDRKTGSLVKKIRSPEPFFAFHHVNAYEEKGVNGKQDKIILDIITYPDASIIADIAGHGYLSTHFQDEENLPSPRLMRYTISVQESLPEQAIQAKVIFAEALELPRINEKYTGYDYRYIYGSDQRLIQKPEDIRPIYKIDIKTGHHQVWKEAGVLPGEPIFVSDPTSQDEDGGVILNIVLDLVNQRAFLLILDGKTFTELGRADTPFAIPVGLHGQFF